jgi:mannan endo-1,4-beta-mannosidase
LAIVALVLYAAPAPAQLCPGCYRYEAESALPQDLHSVNVSSAGSGYSGTGYLTNFNSQTNSDYFELKVDVPNGLYEMWVGYRSQFGPKGYEYWVDSEHGSGMFDQSSTFTADRAGLFNVTGGVNTLGIRESWGFYDVDYLEFRPFTPPAVQPISTQLTDESANQNTQMLMNYLTGIYGQKTLAGQQGEVGETVPFPTQDYLNKSGGVIPAVRGSDFIFYSPSFVQYQDRRNGETDRIINWAKQTGGVATMMWHWNAPANLVNSAEYPWWRGFYTEGTTFNLAGALANPTGSDYQLILRDIDTISRELLKFQEAGVPVIWRPLHEAQGNANGTSGNGAWFWWGAHGPTAFKQLWRLVYDRLTTPRADSSFPGGQYPGLHNLIWEFTSSAANTGYLNWYPGDDVVDMIGLDIYTDPSSSMSGQWYDVLAQYNGRKMIALSETGTLPDPDLLNAYGIKWSYASPWNWDFVKNQYAQAGYSEAQIQSILQKFLNDANIITLNELPTLPWSNSAPLPGDYNRNGSVDIGDYVLWRKTQGQTGWGLAADSDLNGVVDAVDFAAWRANFGQSPGGGSIAGGAVPEPQSLGPAGIALLIFFKCRRRTAAHFGLLS